MFAASFLGDVTGFDYSLVATPPLLLLGFPLPFVVTVNLALACITRMPVAYRFRADLNARRATGDARSRLRGRRGHGARGIADPPRSCAPASKPRLLSFRGE